MFQGHIAMMGNGHIFIPGFAILVGDVELNVSQWGGNSTTSPPPSEAHWTRIIVNKDIQGDSYFRPGDFGGVFDLVYDYDLQIKNFAVPAHANVLFQVSTSWATGTSDFGGNIYVDFANHDHKIMCPYVALEVLGEASGNVGLGT
jgi:hypothetical protein